MTTAQMEAVPKEDLDCSPYHNVSGDEWIVEAHTQGHDAIMEYASAEECRDYINSNPEQWDEYYNI